MTASQPASLQGDSPKHAKHHGKGHNPPPEEERAALVLAVRAALGGSIAEVDAQLKTGGEEGATEAQMLRWLAARGWDPERAAHDLAAHASWRAAFAPAGRVLDEEVANDIAQRKLFVQGPSAGGKGVVVFVGKNHIPRPDQTEIQRFFCYGADAAIRLADPTLNPGGKVQFVFMSAGFGWANFDVAGLSMLFKMIHTHYVEVLETMYIHGASAAFSFLYKVVEPFIDPVTRKKVVLLPRDAAAAAAVLERDLGRDVLPTILGGAAEPRPAEEAWAMIEVRPGGKPRAAAAAAAAAVGDALGGLSVGGGPLEVKESTEKQLQAMPA